MARMLAINLDAFRQRAPNSRPQSNYQLRPIVRAGGLTSQRSSTSEDEPMTRSADQWATPPNLPPDHYISSLVYSDPEIFREEQEKIFKKAWKLACHESEVAAPGDYRTMSFPGTPVGRHPRAWTGRFAASSQRLLAPLGPGARPAVPAATPRR